MGNYNLNKIGAIIITYNPDVPRLRLNIKAICPQVGLVLIVDNGSNNIGMFDSINFSKNVKILKLGENKGIAAAQNAGIRYLEENDYDWVVTLDQDSVMPSEALEKMTATNQFKNKKTGILAAQYNDSKWTDAQRRLKVEFNDNVIEKLRVIASGNLVRIAAWNFVGGFDEWMFIDQVDFDFNAKMVLAGYKVWQVNSVVMNHAVGEVIQKPILSRILLFPKSAIFADHSAFREYYIQRNTIIYAKRYPEFRRHRLQSLVSMVQSRRILVYSGPHFKKLAAAWRGIVDGVKYDPTKDKQFAEFRLKCKKVESLNDY